MLCIPASAAVPLRHFERRLAVKPLGLRIVATPNAISVSGGDGFLPPAPVARKRKRYRKQHPGEAEGIAEEMRFVAMRLRTESDGRGGSPGEGRTEWVPTLDGLLKYLVDSKLVFDTVERIIHESTDVSHVYFRNCGLERSGSIAKDLERFREQELVIPEPSTPGLTYATYLKDIAENSTPSFLCHYYNIYFAHVTGGVGIGRKVCEKLLEGRQLEFYHWDGNVELLLKDMREKLNKLSMHWTRDQKNRCLKEAAKSFRFSGQIIRLIIL